VHGYTLAVTPDMFSGGATLWSATCTIAYTPTNLPGPSGSERIHELGVRRQSHGTLSLGVEEVNPDPQGGQPPIDLPQWLVSGRGS
jgi:hypothetical protein